MHGVSVVGVSGMGSLNLKWTPGCLVFGKVESSYDKFNGKERRGARFKGGRSSVIVATGPAIDQAPAIAQEPLTKDHLIHYMASGCKPKQNWRLDLHIYPFYYTFYCNTVCLKVFHTYIL